MDVVRDGPRAAGVGQPGETEAVPLTATFLRARRLARHVMAFAATADPRHSLEYEHYWHTRGRFAAPEKGSSKPNEPREP